jgi:hypothetical protein
VDTQGNLVENLVAIAGPVPAMAPHGKSAPLVQRGFTAADILWAVGIWSVIICLSPVIVFYMLMVA